MRILVLDAALAKCQAAVVADGVVLAERRTAATQGHAALLPMMTRSVLAEARTAATGLDLVATIVGPGSFTGIRAALALAHGLAAAAGIAVIGVTVGEAIADSLPHLGQRELWVATDSRRHRVFLERDATVVAVSLDALPRPERKLVLAGDAAAVVAATLAARDADVMLTDAHAPLPRHIAVMAGNRLAGRVRPLPAQPLYVDAPEARLPAGGLRPAPAG